ncbi:MAG: glycine cleavage system protein H [Bryobacteraceae bacterium]
MTVILVLATFIVFVLLDWFLNRSQAPAEAVVPVQATGGDFIDGFLTPAKFRYHPGHSWLERERPNRVRVGIDEFAATLVGRIDSIEMPKPGQWIRQGQRVFAFLRNGERVEIVSPIEGEVVEVNTQAAVNPEILRQDPYGKGWLLGVHVPDEEGTLRNLVPVNLVASWMREAVERLYSLQPRFAGATAADGGRPIDDIWQGLPTGSWKATASKFFLTA